MDKVDITDKIKQQRMKREIQFARESSTTLPSVDPLFKVQITFPTGKRRDIKEETRFTRRLRF